MSTPSNPLTNRPFPLVLSLSFKRFPFNWVPPDVHGYSAVAKSDVICMPQTHNNGRRRNDGIPAAFCQT